MRPVIGTFLRFVILSFSFGSVDALHISADYQLPVSSYSTGPTGIVDVAIYRLRPLLGTWYLAVWNRIALFMQVILLLIKNPGKSYIREQSKVKMEELIEDTYRYVIFPLHRTHCFNRLTFEPSFTEIV